MLEHHFINFHNSTIHYTKQGSQTPVLICFHGHGWNCYNFDYIMPELVQHFTVYSFDLFAHGESEWKEEEEFSQDHFKNIFEIFFKNHDIHQFSVMGYSLGGRWATSLMASYSNQTKAIYLVAADGLKRGTIIDILSRIKQTNKIINYFIKHPKLFLGGIKLGYLMGMIDREARDFYLGKNDTPEKRALILKRIKLCKNLLVPTPELIQKIKDNHISVHLFYGSSDFVMPVLLTNNLVKALGKDILHKIDDDHMLVIKNPFMEAVSGVLKTI